MRFGRNAGKLALSDISVYGRRRKGFLFREIEFPTIADLFGRPEESKLLGDIAPFVCIGQEAEMFTCAPAADIEILSPPRVIKERIVGFLFGGIFAGVSMDFSGDGRDVSAQETSNFSKRKAASE